MRNNNSSTTRPVIVVLNWNGLDDTRACLASLERLQDMAFDVIVVDNASTEPDTIPKLKQMISASPLAITLLSNNSNLGFAGGVNTAIRHALASTYTHIALINNDAIVEPGWLATLLGGFEQDSSIGIVTCKLLHEDGLTIDSTGEEYSMWGLPFPRLRGGVADRAPSSGYVFGASGGASVYAREVFESVGMFDEVFFAYYEDTDISFRAQLKGWKVYYESAATAFHIRGSASSKVPGFTTKQAIRNLPLLFIRNVPKDLLIPIGLRFWPAYLLISAKAIFSPNVIPAVLGLSQGVWLFWTHGLPERFNIQKLKTISSAELRKLLWNDLPPDQTGLRKLFGKSVK